MLTHRFQMEKELSWCMSPSKTRQVRQGSQPLQTSPPPYATPHRWCCGRWTGPPLADPWLELISGCSHWAAPVPQTRPCHLGRVEVPLAGQSETWGLLYNRSPWLSLSHLGPTGSHHPQKKVWWPFHTVTQYSQRDTGSWIHAGHCGGEGRMFHYLDMGDQYSWGANQNSSFLRKMLQNGYQMGNGKCKSQASSHRYHRFGKGLKSTHRRPLHSGPLFSDKE